MGAIDNPNAFQPLDPFLDPHPFLNWITEVGPSLLEAIKAMLGFVIGAL